MEKLLPEVDSAQKTPKIVEKKRNLVKFEIAV
jgi:hypothetical protein